MTAEDLKEFEKIFVTRAEFETPQKISVSGDANGSAEFIAKKICLVN